jgi:hypothetical protein
MTLTLKLHDFEIGLLSGDQQKSHPAKSGFFVDKSRSEF